MARIELRHATIRLKDGFSGTAAINDTPADGVTTLDIDTVSVNSPLGTDVIPVGARFTFTADTVRTYTVTGRTPTDGSATTTNIVFTPALATATLPSDDDVLTFTSQQLDVTIGDGNLTYSEAKAYDYELDRGNLDTVREGDDQPLDVSLEFVYDFVTTGTGETITPVDALKQKGAAAEWVSSATDPCEPYAVDMEVEYLVPCGSAGTEDEVTIFPDFRYEGLDFDLSEATISVSGRCNATEASVTRV